MLAICRFDADQNGNLTDREYRVFQEGGKELLRNTVTTCAQPYPAGHRVWVWVRVRVSLTLPLNQVTTCANLGVVASLLIAATHQVRGGWG